MPYYDVKVLAKSANAFPLTIANNNIFGNAINFNVSGDRIESNRICLTDSVLNLSLLVTNSAGPVAAFEVIKNACSWINNTQMIYTNKEGQSHNENSYNKRGEAGGLMLLIDNSYSQTVDSAMLYYSIVPISVTTTKFQVSIPFKFVIDMFMSKKYLDMYSLQMNVNFLPLNQVFSFPGPDPNTYNVQATSAMLFYSMYSIDLMQSDQYYLKPNVNRIWSQQYQILQGQNTMSVQLSPPGKLEWLCFYFGSPTNTYNAWFYSLPTLIQLQNVSNKAWPTNSQYEVDNPTSVTFNPQYGYNRFYHEFLGVADKLSARENTYITNDTWLSDFRVYAIDCADEAMEFGTYNLQVNQNIAATSPLTMNLFGAYTPRGIVQESGGHMTGASIH